MKDDTIRRQAAIDVIEDFPHGCVWNVESMEDMADRIKALPSAQPEVAKDTNVPSNDCISRQAAIDAIAKMMPTLMSADGSHPADADILKAQDIFLDCMETIEILPSAQPEWNNHTVACLLAELFDDTCACNYNGIDEWLPEKCELLDSCPNPGGVACWEQFLKHKAERRTDEDNSQI